MTNATKHPLYAVWNAMRARCRKSSHPAYPRYGGRGIRVCARWRRSFDHYVEDVGPKPGPGYSLDRIDNDGDYEPGNVRWATPRQQQNNTRRNVFVEAFGESLTISQWARRIGISPQLIHSRLKSGRTPEQALSAGRLRSRRGQTQPPTPQQEGA